MLGQEALSQVPQTSPPGPYPYEGLPGVSAVLVQPDGHFDLSRSLATLNALEDARQSGRVRGLVWDVRNRLDHPSASEIRALVSYFDRWDRVAVLTGPDVQYAMARLAALLSDRVAAARTAAEAVSWMRGAAKP